MLQNELYDPLQYLKDIGTSLSDFKEIENNGIPFYILGKGNFAYTEKMTSIKDNKIYAIKKLDTSGNFNAKSFERETKISISLNHENIVRFYGYFQCEENIEKIKKVYKNNKKSKDLINQTEDKKIYCLVLEFVENGSLQDYYKKYKAQFKDRESFIPLDQKIVLKFAKQILSALKYIHQMNIAHRDIKPDNILLDKDNNIKIADFGISAIFKDDNNGNENIDEKLVSHCTTVGRIDYVCPEIYKNQAYDCRCDIYSLGLTLLYLMSYDNPINMINDPISGIPKRQINKLIDNKVYNEYFIKLIHRMLEEDINDRPFARQAYNEIEYIEKIIENPNDEVAEKYLKNKDKKKMLLKVFERRNSNFIICHQNKKGGNSNKTVNNSNTQNHFNTTHNNAYPQVNQYQNNNNNCSQAFPNSCLPNNKYGNEVYFCGNSLMINQDISYHNHNNLVMNFNMGMNNNNTIIGNIMNNSTMIGNNNNMNNTMICNNNNMNNTMIGNMMNNNTMICNNNNMNNTMIGNMMNNNTMICNNNNMNNTMIGNMMNNNTMICNNNMMNNTMICNNNMMNNNTMICNNNMMNSTMIDNNNMMNNTMICNNNMMNNNIMIGNNNMMNNNIMIGNNNMMNNNTMMANMMNNSTMMGNMINNNIMMGNMMNNNTMICNNNMNNNNMMNNNNDMMSKSSMINKDHLFNQILNEPNKQKNTSLLSTLQCIYECFKDCGINFSGDLPNDKFASKIDEILKLIGKISSNENEKEEFKKSIIKFRTEAAKYNPNFLKGDDEIEPINAFFGLCDYLNYQYRKIQNLCPNEIYKDLTEFENLPKEKFPIIYDKINQFVNSYHSPFANNFYYILLNISKCPNCISSFIPLNGSIIDSIGNLVNDYISKQYNSDNSFCDNCNYFGPGKKEKGFLNTPKYLIFDFVGENEMKILDNEIDLTYNSITNIGSKKYKVFSFITKERNGKYKAYIKKDEKNWFSYSDENTINDEIVCRNNITPYFAIYKGVESS